MREVLFKAKMKSRPDTWVEGFYCSRNDMSHHCKEDNKKIPVCKMTHYIMQDEMIDWGLPNEFVLYKINPDTLCQYVDYVCEWEMANYTVRKKLFEHDIITINYGGFIIEAEIIIRDGRLMLKSEYFANGTTFFNTKLISKDYKNHILNTKIVGNIFDKCDEENCYE